VSAAMLTAAAPLVANAQQSRTFMTKAYPVSRGGQNIACSLEFEAGIADFVYRQGAVSLVAGSLTFYGYRGDEVQPFVGLKLVVKDMDTEGQELTARAPAQISVFGKNGKSLSAGYYGGGDGETPGSTIASFAFDQSFDSVIASISQDDRLVVAFNRTKGGMDVRIPVDLKVGVGGQSEHQKETALEFLTCVNDLAQELEAKLK